MPSTLNPACPLCGLRYANRPLLELHIREDHPRRDRPPSQATNETTTTTAAPPPRQPGPGGEKNALRRAIGRLKTLNDDFLRVPGSVFRPAISAGAAAPSSAASPGRPAGRDGVPPRAVPPTG